MKKKKKVTGGWMGEGGTRLKRTSNKKRNKKRISRRRTCKKKLEPKTSLILTRLDRFLFAACCVFIYAYVYIRVYLFVTLFLVVVVVVAVTLSVNSEYLVLGHRNAHSAFSGAAVEDETLRMR